MPGKKNAGDASWAIASTKSSRSAARRAGLRYMLDDRPGIQRRGSPGRFRYFHASGRTVRGKDVLKRIASLVIPPAWKDVWISPIANSHLQAVGVDERGRRQYRYHTRWRAVRDEAKYAHLVAFGHALPRIRRRVAKDLRRKGLPREKVLAAVVRLLEKTLIRVGNDEYANSNHSFGLTTIRDRHAVIRGRRITFRFKGKSRVHHEIVLESPKLAKIVRKCQDLPGQELFQYLDENSNVCDVTSADVNEYLHEVAGKTTTAKDFRTWAGTVLAARSLRDLGDGDTERTLKKNIVRATEIVASRLGNTRAVCRKCYIHPAVLNAYAEGTLRKQFGADGHASSRGNVLDADETFVLSLLQKLSPSHN